eukprot:gene20475-22491_t
MDSLLLLNEKTEIAALEYFIAREFVRTGSKSCFLIKPSSCQPDFTDFESYVNCLTDLCIQKVTSLDQQVFLEPCNKVTIIFTASMDTIDDIIDKKTIFNNLCLLLIDLTELEAFEIDTLHTIKMICDACQESACRVVLLVDIERYLSNPRDLQDLLENKLSVLHLDQHVACDSLPFCNNGNIVEIVINVYDHDFSQNQATDFISEYLQSICDFLSVYKADRSYCCNGNYLQVAMDLRLLLADYGLLALCQGLMIAEDFVEGWNCKCGQDKCIMIQYMESQIMILDQLAKKLVQVHQGSKIKELLSRGFRELINLVSKVFKQQKTHSDANATDDFEGGLPSLCIIVGSHFIGKAVCQLICSLQREVAWLIPSDFSVCLQKFRSPSRAAESIVCLSQYDVEGAQLSRAVFASLKAPSHYNELLAEINIFHRNVKEMVYIISSKDLGAQERLNGFQVIQTLLARRMPSYIDPYKAEKLLLQFPHNLPPVSISGLNHSLSPEEAVNVVNRYCNFLSSGHNCCVVLSVHQSTTVIIDQATTTIKAQTNLDFPARSLLKQQIHGPWVGCNADITSEVYVRMLARMAACQEACKRLQATGELDDSLVPCRRGRDTGCPQQEDKLDDDVIALSQKKLFHNEIPRLLAHSFPKVGDRMYVYLIKRRSLNASQDQLPKRSLGFCTTKQLPKIPSFHIWVRWEKAIITITEVSDSIIMDQKLYDASLKFNFYVVNTILQYDSEKPTGHFEHDVTGCNGLLWTVLKDAQDGTESNQCHDNRQLKFKDAIVSPVHRNDQNTLFYVHAVRNDMSVSSPFPGDGKAADYASYFKQRYDIDLRSDQCLLELRYVKKKANFLLPRRDDEVSDNSRTGSGSKPKKRSEVFLPVDLCRLCPIGNTLWKQLIVIPTILHRLSCVLLVHQLQAELFGRLCLVDASSEVDLIDYGSSPMFGLHTPGNSAVYANVYRIVGEERSTREGGRVENDCKNARTKSRKDEHREDCMALLYCSQGIPKNTAHDDRCGVPISRSDESREYAFDNVGWQRGPSLSLLLAAFTTAHSCEAFHHERLEFIGDAFLNAFVCIELHCHWADESEGALSLKKSADVSNWNLFERGEQLGLWRYVVDEAFDAKSSAMVQSVLGPAINVNNTWFPTAVRKKAIADSVEALIGLFYLHNGEDVTVELMSWLGFSICCIPKSKRIVEGATGSNCAIQKQGGGGMNQRGGIGRCVTRGIGNVCRGLKIGTAIDEDIGGGIGVGKGRGIVMDIERSVGLDVSRGPGIGQGIETDVAQGICSRSSGRGRGTVGSGGIGRGICRGIGIERNFGSDESSLLCGAVLCSPDINSPVTSSVVQSACERDSRGTILGEYSTSDESFHKQTPDLFLEDLRKFEKQINYEFRNKDLLYEALLHKSYPRIIPCPTTTYCNQRLELLGDSLLTLLVTRYLCFTYPYASNAQLTILRSVVVACRTQATIAAVNRFHEYILFLSADAAKCIKLFVEEVKQQLAAGTLWSSISAEDLMAYRHNAPDKFSGIKIPKDIDDVFESVAAAIYLDSHDIEQIWRCYYPMMKDVFGKRLSFDDSTPWLLLS